MGEQSRHSRDPAPLRFAPDIGSQAGDVAAVYGGQGHMNRNSSNSLGLSSAGRQPRWYIAPTFPQSSLLPLFSADFPFNTPSTAKTATVAAAAAAAASPALPSAASSATAVGAATAAATAATTSATATAKFTSAADSDRPAFSLSQSQGHLRPELAPLSSPPNATFRYGARMDQSSGSFNGTGNSGSGRPQSSSGTNAGSVQGKEPRSSTLEPPLSGLTRGVVEQPNLISNSQSALLPASAGKPLVTAAFTRSRYYDPARDLNHVPPITIPRSLSPVTSPATNTLLHDGDTSLAKSNDLGQFGSVSAAAFTAQRSLVRPGPDPLPRVESRFRLEILEQPTAARASTYGDRDRRVINPPPILKLSLKDYDPSNESDRKLITWPYNIVHCTLWRTPEIDSDISECVEVTAFDPTARRREGGLMGSLVANPYVIETPNEHFDESGDGPTSYYVFHDLSCRTTGLYRLRFELTHIGEGFLRPGAVSPTIAYAWSTSFEVYSAKDFPGVRPSSRLLVYLKNKGVNVTIKKGGTNESTAGKRARARLPSDDDDSRGDADHEAKKPRNHGSEAGATSTGKISTSLRFPGQPDPGG